MQDDEKRLGKWILIIIIVLLLAIVVTLGFLIGSTELKKKSLNNLRKDLHIEFAEDMIVTLEAGQNLTFSDDSGELSKIPIELRIAILSYPKDSVIICTDPDLESVGRQEIIFKVTKTDRFGQSAEAYQPFNIEVVDSFKPDIKLKSSRIEMKGNTSATRMNVESVTDPVFGDYSYQENGGPKHWWIDSSKIKWNKDGNYTVSVVVNDSGTLYTQDFEVVYEADQTITSSENTYDSSSSSSQTTVSTQSREESIQEAKSEAEKCIGNGGIWTDEGCKFS